MPSKKKRSRNMASDVALEDVTVKDAEDSGNTDNDDDDDDDQSEERSGSKLSGQEIDVEFEAWPILDSDYDAIKAFLQQTFLKAHIDLAGLTDIIIGNQSIGCIYKPAFRPDETSGAGDNPDANAKDAKEESMEIDDDDIYGVMSVINLKQHEDKQWVKDLRLLLSKRCKDKEIWSKFESAWQGLGWIISERFVNIPYQIALPSYQSLRSDLDKAIKDGLPFQFSNFMVIAKIHKIPGPKLGKSKSKPLSIGPSDDPDVIFANPEDEFLQKESVAWFEYCVKQELESSISGPDDCSAIPWRRVMLISSEGLNRFIDRLNKELSN